ncbi:hypothetical protein EYF80_025778 [Liparis tanakae]|uniref:Uncharacterized protein n=1 Tax=Liparis tanakae TaxID=230148 RepID=A0A4Z2HFI2_9TELE|nr:hypothetical protein EYF80_025778 [Liparis tanakae]
MNAFPSSAWRPARRWQHPATLRPPLIFICPTGCSVDVLRPMMDRDVTGVDVSVLLFKDLTFALQVKQKTLSPSFSVNMCPAELCVNSAATAQGPLSEPDYP